MGRKLLVLLMICLTVESFTPESIYAGLFCHRLRRRRCCCEQHEDFRAPPTTICRTALIATYTFGGTCAYKMYQMKSCPDGALSGVTTNCNDWPVGDCGSGPDVCPPQVYAPKVPQPNRPNMNNRPQKGQPHESSGLLDNGIGQWISDASPAAGYTKDPTTYQVHLPGNRWALLVWMIPNNPNDEPIGTGYEIQAQLPGVTIVPPNDVEWLAAVPGTPLPTAASISLNVYLNGPDVNRYYVVRMR